MKLESCIKCGARPKRVKDRIAGYPDLYETKCRKCCNGVRCTTQAKADKEWNDVNHKG